MPSGSEILIPVKKIIAESLKMWIMIHKMGYNK